MSTTSSPINDRKDILAALEIALAEHCWSPEKSKEAMDKFRSEFEAKDIFNARTLKKHHEKLDLTVGQRDVLDDVLSLIDGPVVAATTQSTASGAASQSHTTGAGGPQQITVKIDKDKVPREMRDKELITAFATKSERTADVIEEARRRFGSRKFFVINDDGTVNVDKTIARQEEDEEGNVYDSLIVATVEEALERDFAADPVNGSKLNKVFKASDGVRWPANDQARLFVIFLRKTNKGGVTAHMNTDARANLADRLKEYPQGIPSYLEDAHKEFEYAVRKKQPIIAQCEAEMQYRPMQNASGGYGNGGYGERTVRQPDGGAWRGDGSAQSNLRGSEGNQRSPTNLLREFILQVLPDDSDLDGFAIDYFSEERPYMAGDVVSKINTLLARVDHQTIIVKLKAYSPSRFERYKHILNQ